MPNPFAPPNEEVSWLIAAKMMVSKAFPYMNTALYSLKVRYTDITDPQGHPTMGIDPRWNLYINPLCEQRWTVHQAAVIIVHELWHVLREHSHRAMERDPKIWNMAADCEINRGSLPYNLSWPDDVLTHKHLNLPEEGLAEDYYDMLTTNKRKSCPKHGKGQGEGKGDCSCKDGEVENESPGKGGCGSGAHGKQMPYEEPGEGESESESQEKTKRIAYDVAKRIKMEQRNPSSERGDVPAGFARWADEVLIGPQIDWRTALRSKVTRAIAYRSGFGRPTYTRRSRRQQAVPQIILPGQRKPIIRVGVQIDTSGSMSDEEIGAILNEIRGILGMGDTQGLYVMCVDAEVHWEGEVTSVNQLELRGGGGTDMGVGIHHAEEVHPKLNVLIVCSDMETPWPNDPPRNISVIGVSTRTNSTVPKWIDLLYIDPAKLGSKKK